MYTFFVLPSSQTDDTSEDSAPVIEAENDLDQTLVDETSEMDSPTDDNIGTEL